MAVGNFDYDEWHDDFPTTHGCPGGGTCLRTISDTRAGWLLGVGWEHVWGNSANWTTKIEYDYIDYLSTNIAYPSANAAIKSFKVSDTKNLIKVGVNFYFP